MNAHQRIQRALETAIARGDAPDAPPRLGQAIQHAVFPGGARIRPQLCIAVSMACGEDDAALADAAAAAIELLHCASLVHDDLPCFDDAAIRRGRASVHRAFGERIAVLAGDALIVLSLQALAHAAERAPARLAPLIMIIAKSVGAPNGIIAGQAWECESQIALHEYQRAKTGALFAAATAAGACAAGHEGGQWHALGERIGEAYQIADDIRDVVETEADLGKPTGRDAVLGRPNAVAQLGMSASVERLEQLVRCAIEAIPPCPGVNDLRTHILAEANRLLPRKLARPAA